MNHAQRRHQRRAHPGSPLPRQALLFSSSLVLCPDASTRHHRRRPPRGLPPRINVWPASFDHPLSRGIRISKRRKALLAQIDRGDPVALERWQRILERRNQGAQAPTQ